jgi:mRNA interferase RelE/StbE
VTEPYDVELSGPAVRAIREELPEALATAIIEFHTRGLRETQRRVGQPLRHELEGPWSARRGAFRVIYEIDETDRLIRGCCASTTDATPTARSDRPSTVPNLGRRDSGLLAHADGAERTSWATSHHDLHSSTVTGIALR